MNPSLSYCDIIGWEAGVDSDWSTVSSLSTCIDCDWLRGHAGAVLGPDWLKGQCLDLIGWKGSAWTWLVVEMVLWRKSETVNVMIWLVACPTTANHCPVSLSQCQAAIDGWSGDQLWFVKEIPLVVLNLNKMSWLAAVISSDVIGWDKIGDGLLVMRFNLKVLHRLHLVLKG